MQIKTLSIKETNRFYRLYHMAEKTWFSFSRRTYFKQMLEIYGDKACMKLAYIDLNKYINLLKATSDRIRRESD